jgi:hypothetical protein
MPLGSLDCPGVAAERQCRQVIGQRQHREGTACQQQPGQDHGLATLRQGEVVEQVVVEKGSQSRHVYPGKGPACDQGGR